MAEADVSSGASELRGAETPTDPLVLEEKPNARAQGMTLVENPRAPPPLELVARGRNAASEKKDGADRRGDLAINMLGRNESARGR